MQKGRQSASPSQPGEGQIEDEDAGLEVCRDLLQRSRRAKAALEGAGADVVAVARVAAAVDALVEDDRARALRFLEALEAVLSGAR